jgi:hypothetical protein
MRFTILSCMNSLERLWIDTSDGEVFEIGYPTLMKRPRRNFWTRRE